MDILEAVYTLTYSAGVGHGILLVVGLLVLVLVVKALDKR